MKKNHKKNLIILKIIIKLIIIIIIKIWYSAQCFILVRVLVDLEPILGILDTAGMDGSLLSLHFTNHHSHMHLQLAAGLA